MRSNFAAAFVAAFFSVSLATADAVYTVTMNTTPLEGYGLFTLDLQLVDGSGLPPDLNDNTMMLEDFQFGGGSPSGGGTATGGAAGSLATGVTLKDSVFFNEYYENFTPGSLLSFRIDTTNVPDSGGTPDLFTMAILDHSRDELPTNGPASEFLDVTLAGGASPIIATYGSAPGSHYSLGAPMVQPQSTVPEPAAFLPVGLILSALAVRRRLKQSH